MSDTANPSPSAEGSNFAFMSVALNGGSDVYTTRCAEIQTRAQNAESNIKTDPRIAGFYARNALELMVETVFDIDNWLTRPRHDATLMSLIHDKDFKQNLETHLFPKLKLVIQVGNEAVHSKTTLPQRDALQAVKELHHVLYWFIRTYTPAFANRELNRNQFVVQPFDEALIPQQVSIDATVATKALSSIKRVKELEKQLEQDDKVEREAYLQQLKENETLKAANQALLEQIEQAKQSAEKVTDAHDYNEDETRTYLIDVLLHEAGWKLEHKRDREYPVSGMPISKVNPKGNGFVDYVLWGDDGTALAVVEAKRANISPEEGKRQAELYANCLAEQCGVRPVIFYTNGYDTHLWDDHFYPPRQVQGFYTKAELELMVKRRTDRKSFFESGMPNSNLVINNEITNRHGTRFTRTRCHYK